MEGPKQVHTQTTTHTRFSLRQLVTPTQSGYLMISKNYVTF